LWQKLLAGSVVPGTGPDAAVKREIRPRRIYKNFVILLP